MYEKESRTVIEAIKTIATRPENLDNLETYLAHSFADWLTKYTNTPDNIANELKMFAEIKI